jgi:hypothetical protein
LNPERSRGAVAQQGRGEASREPINDDMEFVKKAEEVALTCGYRPIELCWMTWLIQPEGKIMRMEKYSNVLPKI